MNWTPDIVMVRLIDAYVTIERLPAQDRRRVGNGWPNMLMFDTASEAFGFELSDLTFNGGESMAVIRETRRDDILRDAKRAVRADAISMAMEAMRWPIEVISDEAKRECLIAYATCRARNREWTKVLAARNERVPKEKTVLRLKSYRWNEQSCQRISDHLSKESVLLRTPLDLRMIQPEAKSTGETDTVASLAWMASDAKPVRLMPEPLETSNPTPRTNQREKDKAA